MKKCLLLLFFTLFLSAQISAQLQSVRIDAEQTGICEEDSLALQLVLEIIGLPSLTIDWSPDIGISDIHSDGPKVSPPTTTKYTVSVYDNKYNIEKKDSFIVTVVPIPKVEAPDDDSVCINNPYNLSPKQFDSSPEIKWTILHGDATFEDTNEKISLKVAPVVIPQKDFLGTVAIEIEGSGIDICNAVKDSMNLYYVEGTTVTNLFIENNEICSHEKVLIEAEANNFEGFKWSHDGDGYFENDNTLTPHYIPDTEEYGTVNIFLDVYGNICNASDSISLNISQMNVEPVDDVVACFGEYLDIAVRASDNLQYQWNTGETENYIRVQAIENELFIVNVTNGEGCYFTDSIYMEVFDLPEIQLNVDYETHIINVSPGNLKRYIFLGDRTDILQDETKNWFYYGDAAVTYDSIYVKAFNEYDCSSAVEKIAIPIYKAVSAFSPNGDGINDRLHIGKKIAVFDRTQHIIYEGWDGWDGNNNGKELPQGVYFYILYKEDGSIFYKGPVTLVR